MPRRLPNTGRGGWCQAPPRIGASNPATPLDARRDLLCGGQPGCRGFARSKRMELLVDQDVSRGARVALGQFLESLADVNLQTVDLREGKDVWTAARWDLGAIEETETREIVRRRFLAVG